MCDMLSLTMQDHCFRQSLWGLRAAQVRRGQQRIIAPEVEQVLAVHLDALQRFATYGGGSCSPRKYVGSDTGPPDASVHVPRSCLAQLRTICESRIGGCSHKLLLQQHLPVHVSDAMALVAFDLQASSTSGATA